MTETPISRFLARPLVLINRRSGTAMRLSPEECCRQVRERFESHGVNAELRCVDPGELQAVLRQISTDPPSALIIGGGDGTVVTGAVAARDAGIPLGVLPLGTFNHAARDLQMPLELDEAIDAIVGGDVREIDLAAVNGRPFLCVCILGFYPEQGNPGEENRGSPWWVKSYLYLRATWRSFATYPRLAFTIRADAEILRVRSRFIAVSNNSYLDMAGVMPRKSSLDGGSLAVYASTHRTLGEVAGASLAFLSGRMEGDSDMHAMQARRVEIACARRRVAVMVDGEVVKEATPLRFSIEHRAFKAIVPAEFKTS
jgi:diacylglycerol kinase family enzyme